MEGMLNPQYDEIGKTFTETYYGIFDTQPRNNLVTLYHVSILSYFLVF